MFYPLHELLSNSPHLSRIPTKKEEKWRFSKLSTFVDKTYQNPVPSKRQNLCRNEKNYVELMNGQLVSHNLPPSVHLREHLLEGNSLTNPFSKFASATSAFPLELNIFEDIELSIYLKYSEQVCVSSNVNIILQEGVNACIYTLFEGADESFVSHVSHVKLEKSSHLILSEIQNLSSKAVIISQDSFYLHEHSHLENFCLLSKAQYLHHFIEADLHYQSTINVSSLLLSKEEERLIFSCDINHLADDSSSSVFSKQVLHDKSTCVFDANTKILQSTLHANVKQESHALLLSEQAQIHSKPHLEIYSDDLSASHGSTVGALDEEAISYLMARGISKKKSHAILVQAFIQESLENISSYEHKEKVIRHLGETYE